MRHLKQGLTLAGIAALLLTACGGGGGGGGGSSSSSGGGNSPPVANAGLAQAVGPGVVVTLNGTGSTDSDGSIASYSWTQTAGSAVTLSSANVAQPTFTAPSPAAATTLTFSLVVTDNRGAASAASTVNISVSALPANIPPTALAGLGQTVNAGVTVRLNGSASFDPDGSIASYAWTQTAGPAVTLANAAAAQTTFTAPSPATATTLTFALVVTDNRGTASPAHSVNVTVNPVIPGNVNIAGKVRFERVGFTAGAPFGLNYGAPTLQPARGVTVRALNAATQAQLAAGSTDSNGDYSLSVAGNTNVLIEVVARMQSPSGQATPNWNIRVQDGVAASAPYSHQIAAFNSGAGVTRNIDIPTGVNASGVATGTRASAPFAILDTIYTAMEAVLLVEPNAGFPQLYVDWGAQSAGTFFTTANGAHIALLSDLTEDTDEFDQHVIAHEFGHFIENSFSRADSIGGAHALGDKLDARVAFGEGFGYAFAAIVLNDPDSRDSFFDGSQQRASRFVVEDNPTGTNGCWCSESSVWSILYDLSDSAADANDTLSLGLQPLWNVLVNAQRFTPAFTTIFSFITGLKAARPGNATAIDTLVAAQNIDSVSMNAFGTGETHFPSTVPQNAALPLHTLATINGGSVTLRTVDDAGSYNKLGNRRYVRFTTTTPRTVTVTLATSNPNANPDPDFILWSGTQFIGASTNPPPGPEVRTFDTLPVGDYLLDVYDCANGCSPPEGTAGDYDLTVTLTSP